MISFRRGHTKVRVLTQEHVATTKGITPLYAEGIDILEGLVDAEVNRYVEENPKIVPLFEIDVIEAVGLTWSERALR